MLKTLRLGCYFCTIQGFIFNLLNEYGVDEAIINLSFGFNEAENNNSMPNLEDCEGIGSDTVRFLYFSESK